MLRSPDVLPVAENDEEHEGACEEDADETANGSAHDGHHITSRLHTSVHGDVSDGRRGCGYSRGGTGWG